VNVGQLYEIGQVVGYVDLIDYQRGQPAEPTISNTAEWFCVTTNPNCTGRAALELYSLGYRTFLPKIRKWATHARVKKAVERPLLGRYLFVEVDHPTQSFGAVRSANGVEALLSSPGIDPADGEMKIRPTPFPSHWVENLRMRYMAGEWDEIAKGKIPIGARIRIVEGEFDKLLATVTGRKHSKLTFKIKDTNTYATMHECSVRAA
jgi:transcription antitermination factor NusG